MMMSSKTHMMTPSSGSSCKFNKRKGIRIPTIKSRTKVPRLSASRTHRIARGRVVAHDAAVGEVLEASMGGIRARRRDVPELDQSVGIHQYVLDDVCGVLHLEVHAQQLALAVGVADALLVAVPPASIVLKIDEVRVGGVDAVAGDAAFAVCVRRAPSDLSGGENDSQR